MELRISGYKLKKPSITKWGFEDLDDAPNLHRWRAYWQGEGIALVAFPVVKETRCGVKIDTGAIRMYRGKTKEWDFSKPWMHRFVVNGSGQSWAKPTQEEAIESLAIRLTRWTQRLAFDLQKAKERCDALENLRPDLADFAKAARNSLVGQ